MHPHLRFLLPVMVVAAVGFGCESNKANDGPTTTKRIDEAIEATEGTEATEATETTEATESTEEPPIAAKAVAEPAPAAVAVAVAAPAKPYTPKNLAALGPGAVPAYGCIGWSKNAKRAACVTGGTDSPAEPPTRTLALVGDARTKLKVAKAPGGDPDDEPTYAIDAGAVAKANKALAAGGFEKLTGAATSLARNKSVEYAVGNALRWRRKMTEKAGDNAAATFRHHVTAGCNEWDKQLFKYEFEGGEEATVSYRLHDGHLIVEFVLQINTEGESREFMEVAVLNTKTCRVQKAGYR